MSVHLIGLLREKRIPPDFRVALTPGQCQFIQENFPVVILAESSPNRCFGDQEYLDLDIRVVDDLSECKLLLGVKEIPVDALISGKTYMFFSHTIKGQSHNMDMLNAVLEKNIRLIDYELLTDNNGRRLIAFGHFAGMVGAHNALYTWGKRMELFDLVRLHDLRHYEDVKQHYKDLKLPNLKVILTGSGRVGTGAIRVLRDLGFYRVSPEDFLSRSYNAPVFTQISSEDYASRKDGKPFDKNDFYTNPHEYESCFEPYYAISDIMINGIFWDKDAPQFFTLEEMRRPNFKIQVIADITCDIAPNASIPSTIRASTIDEPIYGFDPVTGKEAKPHQRHVVDVMAVDNLPNELARDASESFGNQFIRHLLPELIKTEMSLILKRATIARDGKLCPNFEYLEEYLPAKYPEHEN